ncbi:TPA: glycosyltransferase family 2 protein [Vibrio cholerae]
MLPNKPTISVIMSVYNGEKYLAEAIESILNQTFSDFEFIIVDDGSTDSSLSIIQAYMEKDDRIVLISRDNKGLPYSLNEGISVSKANYIARMDADDISLPERLETQLAVMENNPDIGVCGALAYLFRETPSKNKMMCHPEDHDSLIIRLLFSVCFIHPVVMIRKSVLNQLDYVYNENFRNSQDYELWSRIAEKTRFYTIQKPLLFYRDTPDGITSKVNDDSLKKRFPLVTQVQTKQLEKLGLKLNDENMIMHFRLGLNAEMLFLNAKADDVKFHLKSVLNANKKTQVFHQKKLYCFLSRKYFVYLFLSFQRRKNVRSLKVFDMMFLMGAYHVIKDRIGRN